MSTLPSIGSLFHDLAGAVPDASPARSKPVKAGSGFWARMMGAIMLAREAQAKREINRYLARQPDRMLYDIGLTDSEIAELRDQNNY